MDAISLTEYISKAKELEVAIFTQKKLMDEHKKLLVSRRPKAPQKQEVNTYRKAPQKPSEPMYRPSKTWRNVAIGVCGFYLIMEFYRLSENGEWTDPSIPVIFLLICAASIFFAVNEWRKNQAVYAEECERHRQAMNFYNKQLADFNAQSKVLSDKYAEALADHQLALAAYKEKEIATLAPHEELLEALEKALCDHYASNLLFAKYRNLVAVTTIDEYLQSGRCDTLAGSGGAYNLYEMELRQNIIIGQLSSVLDNMEQIKANQYTLYQELSAANNSIHEIISDLQVLKSVSKLNAYFSAVSALVDVSPKITHGIIY